MGQVTTTIRVVDKASKQLNSIYRSIQRVNTVFNSFGNSNSFGSAERKIRSVDTALKKLPQNNVGLDRVEKEVRDIGNAASSSANQTNLLISKLKRLASTYLGVMAGRAIIGTADELTSANNKFVTYGTNAGMDTATAESFSAETQEKIFNAAQDSLVGYTDMMTNVAKSITLAGDAFGETTEQQIDNAVKFQEIMSKSYALGGASAAEMSSSMYQLVQALGSGNLAGDELRSVREGAPLAAKGIEEFAQSVLGTTKTLKEMGAEGLITSEMVVAGVLNMAGETEKAFEYIRNNMTFEQMWTKFKNDSVRAFQPFLETLREIGNNPGFQRFIEWLTDAMYTLGGIADWVATKFNNAFTWIENNWSTIEPIITAVSAAVLFLAGVAIVQLIARLTMLAVKFMIAHWRLALFAGIIMLVVWYFKIMGLSAQTLGEILLVLGVIGFIAGLMIAAPLYIIIGIILILTGLFLMFTEEVMGALYTVGAFIWNLIVAVWNVILGFVEAVWNVIATLANFLGNVFVHPIGAIVGLFIDLADIVLGILETIASAIDAIFGSNLAGAVRGWRDGMYGWYNNTFERTEIIGKFDKDAWSLDRWAYGEAWDLGVNTGSDIRAGIDDVLNSFSMSDLVDKMNPEGVEADMTGIDVGSSLGNVGDIGDIGKDVGKISDDMSDISKSMDLTEEDLKYLRQIAEMEAINRFTTAEIKVEMTNNNNVNEASDLDGIVTHLRTTLQEELQVLKDGVHSA